MVQVRNLRRQKTLNELILSPPINGDEAGLEKDKVVAGGNMVE